MKAVAETLGVSRSNLVERLAEEARSRVGAITRRKTRRSCLWCAGWSMRDRPTAIVG